MIEKTKRGQAARQRLGRLLASLIAGALFLTLAGTIIVAAVSISQRPHSPEDIVRQRLSHQKPHWHENPDHVREVTDIEIWRRHIVDELNAVHVSYTWQSDSYGQRSKCRGDILAQAYPDFFGGWRELGYIGHGCSNVDLISDYLVNHSYWDSLPLEFPHQYHFYAFGSGNRATQVEVMMADGSLSERATVVDGEYVLLLQRDEPFRVEKLHFIGADGEVFARRKVGR